MAVSQAQVLGPRQLLLMVLLLVVLLLVVQHLGRCLSQWVVAA
jgi:hypothetical protein